MRPDNEVRYIASCVVIVGGNEINLFSFLCFVSVSIALSPLSRCNICACCNFLLCYRQEMQVDRKEQLFHSIIHGKQGRHKSQEREEGWVKDTVKDKLVRLNLSFFCHRQMRRRRRKCVSSNHFLLIP